MLEDKSDIEDKVLELTTLGDKEYDNKNFVGALDYYKQALTLGQPDCFLYKKIADCLENLGLYDITLEFLTEAVIINPQYHEAYKSIETLYSDKLKEYKKGIEYFKKLLNQTTNNPYIFNALGLLYKKSAPEKTAEEQLKYFKKAVDLKPDFQEALWNLAMANIIQGDEGGESIKYFEKLTQLRPDFKDAYFLLACQEIQSGDFKNGWKNYESRFEKNFNPTIYPHTDKPKWYGEKIPGKTLLIQFEQGFGDSIQFCRYIEQVKPLVGKIIFRVHEELLDLMKSNLKDIEVVGSTVAIEELSFDYHVALISLMHILNADINNIPMTDGYIQADEKLVQQYKKDFFDNECFKIGICWNGRQTGNERRNIPLEAFYPLAKIKNAKIYSFQKYFGSEQLDKLPSDIEIIDLGKTFNNFSDTAAAMANLDLFVTSDNGVLHIAAAMGKKTFLLLNKKSEWRWMSDDNTTPWYNSIKILKKVNEEDSWGTLTQRIIKIL